MYQGYMTPEEIQQRQAYLNALRQGSMNNETPGQGRIMQGFLYGLLSPQFYGQLARQREQLGRMRAGEPESNMGQVGANPLPGSRTPSGGVSGGGPSFNPAPPQQGNAPMPAAPSAAPTAPPAVEATPPAQPRIEPVAPSQPPPMRAPRAPSPAPETMQALPNETPDQPAPEETQSLSMPNTTDVRRANAERTNIINIFRNQLRRDPTGADMYAISKMGLHAYIGLLNATPNQKAIDVLGRYHNNSEALRTAYESLLDLVPSLRALPPEQRNNLTAGQLTSAIQNRFNNDLNNPRAGTGDEFDQPSRLGNPPQATPTPTQTESPQADINSPSFPPRTFPTGPDRRGPPVENIPGRNPFRRRVAQAAGGQPSDISAHEQANEANVPVAQQPQPTNVRPNNVPESIPPDPNINRLRSILSQGGSMLTEQQLKEYGDSFQTLSGPQPREFPFGTAYYNGQTGRFMYFVPKLFQRDLNAENLRQFITPNQESGNLQVNPIGGGGTGNTGGGAGGTGNNPAISPNSGPFPENATNPGEIRDWNQRSQTLGEMSRTVGGAQAKNVASAIEAAAQAPQQQQLLRVLKDATERAGRFNATLSGGPWRGQGFDLVQSARKFLSNLGFNYDTLPDSEVIEKFIGQLSSQATRELSARPSNFEFETFMRLFPGLGTSFNGATMMLDMLEQMQERTVGFAQYLDDQQLTPDRFGEFNKIKNDYYASHPIIINVPATANNPAMRVNTKKFNNLNEAASDPSLTSGMVFMFQGKLYRKD